MLAIVPKLGRFFNVAPKLAKRERMPNDLQAHPLPFSDNSIREYLYSL